MDIAYFRIGARDPGAEGWSTWMRRMVKKKKKKKKKKD